MSAETTSKAIAWTGRVLTGLFAAFMVMDTGIKLARLPVVAQTLGQLGYPPEQGLAIGIIEAICLALYLWPRTAVLGAILFTAVMGGAIASHMRLNDPLVSHTLFGVWLGLLMWGGLWLRDGRLRTMIPLRRP